MALELLGLDYEAQKIVLRYRDKDSETAKQAHKMRSTVAYGLERFWGERLRLEGHKASYWQDVWKTLADILNPAGIVLPDANADTDKNDSDRIEAVTQELWTTFPIEQRKVALAVLTEFCDCLVWWTQRYKH